MREVPKYTLLEAQEAKRSLVSTFEFAFFTALADLTEIDVEPHIGPVDGGEMKPHRGRRQIIEALLERLLDDDEIAIYPVTASQAVGTEDANA